MFTNPNSEIVHKLPLLRGFDVNRNPARAVAVIASLSGPFPGPVALRALSCSWYAVSHCSLLLRATSLAGPLPSFNSLGVRRKLYQIPRSQYERGPLAIGPMKMRSDFAGHERTEFAFSITYCSQSRKPLNLSRKTLNHGARLGARRYFEHFPPPLA